MLPEKLNGHDAVKLNGHDAFHDDGAPGAPTRSEGSGSWEEAKKYRYDCGVMQSLLRQQVPVLDFVQFTVTCIEQGSARTMLPLISPSTNQHCTHQAALLFLAADYTGGIAVGSLIPGRPLMGVHPVAPTEQTTSLWLVKGEIKFLRPSVGRLEITADIEPERSRRIKKRYEQGKTVLETVTVQFRNGAVDVAEASMTYYARQSEKLRSDGASPEKVNILYQHKLVSSAELIAGVRARESGRLFEDPFAARVAGEHGLALAARFCEKTPQLGGMVAARTRHLDAQILDFVRTGGRDLVILGAGFDMRPFRLALPAGTRVFELDFPSVLADRQQRLAGMGVKDPPHVTRIQVPIDLRATTLANALRGAVDFASPVFIAWEGMSMYFEEAEVRAMLAGMAPLLRNNRSRLWLDLVDRRAIFDPDVFPEVKAFMTGMQMLGEPFVFGVVSAKDFMESNGFHCHQAVSSDIFLGEKRDPVFSVYHFCTASADAAVLITVEHPVWTAHPPHAAVPAVVDPAIIPAANSVNS
jgi:methyltransferase (TIGR00027 family)